MACILSLAFHPHLSDINNIHIDQSIQVKVFWVVMPCSVVVGYQHFRGPCCLDLQGDEDGGSKVLKKLLSNHNTEDLNLNLHCH
jgi:hypothetical protein